MNESDKKKYTYDRFGSKGMRVGQAVYDILSKDQPTYTAEDILNEYAPKYMEEIERCIESNKDKLRTPFYVFVLTHKEMWAENVVRNWFIARQTPPHALDAVTDYPHHTKTLYLVDTSKGKMKLCWTLPGLEDCKSVTKNPQIYDPSLVKWIRECFEGKLDKDCYSFE